MSDFVLGKVSRLLARDVPLNEQTLTGTLRENGEEVGTFAARISHHPGCQGGIPAAHYTLTVWASWHGFDGKLTFEGRGSYGQTGLVSGRILNAFPLSDTPDWPRVPNREFSCEGSALAYLLSRPTLYASDGRAVIPYPDPSLYED